MLVSKPTPGGGAPLGIDLEGGKAKITLSMPTSTEQEDEAADDATLEDQTVDTAQTDESDEQDA